MSYEGGTVVGSRIRDDARAGAIDATAFDLAVRREFARQVLASLEVVRLGLIEDKDVAPPVRKRRVVSMSCADSKSSFGAGSGAQYQCAAPIFRRA